MIPDVRRPSGDEGATGREVEVIITPCPDGPLLVRGPARIIDSQGNSIEPHRSTFALCRCGGSAIPPWCDGTHKVNGFRTQPQDSGAA